MNPTLRQLLAVLDPSPQGDLVFRAENMHPGAFRVYGGQVLAQAQRAAVATVPQDRVLHSQHAYFLRPGDPKEPIVYEVENARDGLSFSSRRVVALQKGRPIMGTSMSFQQPSEGSEFQPDMPDGIPAPETLVSERQLGLDSGKLYEEFMITTGPDLDVRVVDPIDWENPRERAPELQVWMKTTEPVGDGIALHQSLLTYMSDAFLIDVCLATRGLTFHSRALQVASLDHAIWFHEDFRADEWLMHIVETKRMSAGRGLAYGSFYRADGVLVASTVQQGLMRVRGER